VGTEFQKPGGQNSQQAAPEANGTAPAAEQTTGQQLTKENQRLKALITQTASLRNRHGQAAPAEISQAVLEEAIKQHTRREGRRWLDAQDWHPPPPSGTLADELSLPRETEPHRIDGLSGWNHNVLVQGPRKAGKTQLLACLSGALSMSRLIIDWPAVAAATAWEDGQEDGDLPPYRPGRFLGLTECHMAGNAGYVNAEMDADDWRDIFRALPPGTYDASRIHALHCRGVPFPVITSDAARQWFVSWLREHSIEVLIIDTWGAFCAKNGVRNLNDDAEARTITDGLDGIKRAAGVSSLVVPIHMPHQVPGMRHLERFKGAGAVGDWADTLWSYVADEDGTRYLSARGRARIEHPEDALYFDPATGALNWALTGSRAMTSASRMEERICEAARKSPGILTEDLKNAAGGHRNDAAKTIAAMVSDGRLKVVQGEKGRAKHHYLSDHDLGETGS
jgi:hypothetical protein